MTMRIVYKKDFEGHKAGSSDIMERTRAVRLMDTGVVEPWMVFQKRLKVEKAVAVEGGPPEEADRDLESKPDPDIGEDDESEPDTSDAPEADDKPKPKKPRGRRKKTEKAVKI